ncbi:MAG: helix-turn-helix transcriptional regulator [Actinobacteria bacterium]|nr:helix-turn-helix transcriptional regulator [Actinomycetota bacterium]
MESRERFARNLRYVRLRAGLSQEALGYSCGLHRTEISLLERGGRDPRLSTVLRLAGALEISPGELLSGINGAPPRSSQARRRPSPP